MADIIKFYPLNAANNPDMVLEQAIGEYKDVLIIGWGNDGELEARATHTLTHEQILWLLEFFKMKLLRGDYSADVEMEEV